MTNRYARSGSSRRLVAEAAATGLAYGSGLCLASTFLVASFRPHDLAEPYWSGVPGLRTDTCGIAAFIATAVSLTESRYLRMRRLQDSRARTAPTLPGRPAALVALAMSETVVVLSAGLVVYLSLNTVTHPATLTVRATHFAPWPTEGTLRVIALGLFAGSVAAVRYLRARYVAGDPG